MADTQGNRATEAQGDGMDAGAHVSAERWLYVARDDRGLVYAACIDDPQYTFDTAKTLADWIKEGATVERMRKAEAIAELGKWTRKPAEPDPQTSLL